MKVKTIAKWSWSIPILLGALTIHQVATAIELRNTLNDGVETWAEVTRYDRSDRKDVTMVEIDMIVHMPDGSQFERNRLTLPYSIGHRVEADTLTVMVLKGTAQEVVIKEIGETHVNIAWSNFGMSFIAFLMAFTGVLAWNRFQSTKEE